MAVLGSSAGRMGFLVAASRGCSLVGLLLAVVFLVAEHGSWALQASGVSACGLSCGAQA